MGSIKKLEVRPNQGQKIRIGILHKTLRKHGNRFLVSLSGLDQMDATRGTGQTYSVHLLPIDPLGHE
jgi:hypothetical protein